MLGISTDRGALARRIALALVTGAVLAACALNAKQGANTGKDGKYKGAKTIELANDAGSASGIVTYPGGDRVDWKLIELPEGKKGTLKLKLTWKPPRPGLDLSFDVYNEFGRKIGGKGPKKSKKAPKRIKRGKKSTTIDEPVKGKVYVAIYASNRGDAGKYKLEVEFAELEAAAVFDPGSAPIPEPPRLAIVPPPCDENAIDPKNPECKGVYPPCDPAKPDKTNPRCTGVYPPCDANAKDRNNPNCKPLFPPCDPMAIDPGNPNCDGVVKPPPEPKFGAIVAAESTSGGTIIHINLGTDDAVATKWKGEVVDSSGKPVPNGAFTIFKAQKKKSFGKTKLPKATIDKNLQVKLYPPE